MRNFLNKYILPPIFLLNFCYYSWHCDKHYNNHYHITDSE